MTGHQRSLRLAVLCVVLVLLLVVAAATGDRLFVVLDTLALAYSTVLYRRTRGQPDP